MVTALVFYGNANFTQVANWIVTVFIVAEIVTFSIVVWVHYLYPKFLNSAWFQTHMGAKHWNVQVVSDWTMTYSEFHVWKRRCTCRYQGEFNATTTATTTTTSELPEGLGTWIDDSYGGEILTGMWKDGKPVAPFVSRQYGTGDAFRCVPIAYYSATDDGFADNKLVPTNEKPATFGVASVECSVQGAFLRNLPAASELFGPNPVMKEEEEDEGVGECLAQCFRHMVELHTEQEQNTYLTVKADDPRGVEVLGHVYKPTGLPLTTEPTQIVIHVQREDETNTPASSETEDCMPFSSFTSKEMEHVLILEDSGRNGEEAKGGVDDLKESKETESINSQLMRPSVSRKAFARLEVQDWTPSLHKEALVFFPGFNSPLSKSLQSLGQFMAMTKVMDHVHPIIFQWPNGQVPTYRLASAISASDRNKKHFLQLVRGLASTGIRHVHFLSHSMGVQTMLAGFQDKEDGSRSDISQCFRLNHSFASGDERDDKLMICKSITMVNPDFPIDAFIDHAFLSIRRICNHVTVVGDRHDQALFYSQVINGMCNYLGYSQPSILNKDGKESNGQNRKEGYHPQNVVGRDIGSLYFPDPQEGKEEGDEERTSLLTDERLLFMGAPAIILSADGHVKEHLWLDVDVIDTTQLDTNIKDLRHSGFNVNPILLNDLEELIVTGRRAANRSTLLFREGNIYSYCHAPSFVTM